MRATSGEMSATGTRRVQNDRMSLRVRPIVRPVALIAAAALVLAGCGSSGGSAEPKTTPLPKASEQTAVPVPSGVTLTEYGTGLKFGQPATVAYAPNDKRRTVLELTVNSVVKGSIADFGNYTLEDRTKQSTPYYVQVTVRNVGDGDVGQTPIPLYLVDNRNILIAASTPGGSFPKCPATPLPVTFAPQAHLTGCLLYLVPDHGTMTGVSFRDVQKYAPIVWTGTVTVPTVAPKPKKKPAKKAS